MTDPHRPTDDEALRLAAPAPGADEPDDDTEEAADLAAAEAGTRHDLDELCERWNQWCRSRRFWVKPSLPQSLLGKLRTKGTGRSLRGGPDAPCDAELLAFHVALAAEGVRATPGASSPIQPDQALDRQVFELHYLVRVRDVKKAAAELGISRAHYYRLLVAFRQRVWRASRFILEANLEAAQQLPSNREGGV